MLSKALISVAGTGGSSSGPTTLINSGASEAAAIDITNPASMSVLDTLASSNLSIGEGWAVNKDDQVVYYTNSLSDIISSIDCSTPTALNISASYNNITYSEGADLPAYDSQAKVLYTLKGASPYLLNSFDVSTPSTLTLRDSISIASTPSMVAMDVDNRIVYVGTVSNMIAVDITNSAALSTIGSSTITGYNSPSKQGYVSPDGTRLIAGSDVYNAIHVYDVSNPASISGVSSFTDPSNIPDVDFINVDWSEDLVFTLGDGYLSSVDMSNLLSLTQLDTIYDAAFDAITHSSIAVDTVNKVLYVAARSNGDIVKAVSYADPSNLTIIGSITNAALTGGSCVLL